MATLRKMTKKSAPHNIVKPRATKTSGRKNVSQAKVAAHKRTSSANGKHPPEKKAKSLQSQKETLQQERAQVESELANLRAEMQQAPEMTGDEVDLNVYEREKTLGLVAAYERRLEEFDATLKVAAQGKYGICERCGNPIPPERLEIFPETRLCVKCKNEVEREQRRLRM